MAKIEFINANGEVVGFSDDEAGIAEINKQEPVKEENSEESEAEDDKSEKSD